MTAVSAVTAVSDVSALPAPPVTVLRCNLVDPAPTPATLSARYRAAVEMAAFADDRGFTMVQTEEHHATTNGWIPSPLTFAGAVFGATRRIGVTVSALITPLHDPLRLAEDIASLDLLSGGRLTTVAGLGYRPEEYAAHGKDWRQRGALQDEVLTALLSAWTGEPFTYRGRTVQVTPRPCTRPHPLLLIGGSSRAAARRAARLGSRSSPAPASPRWRPTTTSGGRTSAPKAGCGSRPSGPRCSMSPRTRTAPGRSTAVICCTRR